MWLERASTSLASSSGRVGRAQQFRDERLGENVLVPEQAEEFLRAEELKDWCEGELSEDPSYAVYLQTLGREELKGLVIGPRHKDAYLSERSAFYEERRALIWFREEEELDLGELSLDLASAYPWAPEDAAWFVLTGEPPEVVSVYLSYRRARGVFTLAFAPWISEETMRQAYRKARNRARGGEGNHQPGEKALTVLCFVSKRTPAGKKPRWTPLMAEWNEDANTPPRWKFKDVSHFRKTYLRTERRVAGPRLASGN